MLAFTRISERNWMLCANCAILISSFSLVPSFNPISFASSWKSAKVLPSFFPFPSPPFFLLFHSPLLLPHPSPPFPFPSPCPFHILPLLLFLLPPPLFCF